MSTYSPDPSDIYPQSIFSGDSFDESVPNLMDSPEPTMFDLSPPLVLFPDNFDDTSSCFADVDCNASNIPHYEPFPPANIPNNNNNFINPCQCNQCNHHQYTNNNYHKPLHQPNIQNNNNNNYINPCQCNQCNHHQYTNDNYYKPNIQNNNNNCINPCQCNHCNHQQYTNINYYEPKCFSPSNQEYTSNSVFPFARSSSTNMSSSVPFIQNQSLSRAPPTFTPIIPYGFNQNIPSIPPLINHNQFSTSNLKCSASHSVQHLSEIQYIKPNTWYYANNQTERDLQTISSDNEYNKNTQKAPQNLNRNVISTSEIQHHKAPSNVIITNHFSGASGRNNRLKRLKCTYCEKCFATNYELKRHEIVHNGERPYKCPLCAKAFRQKQHMSTHYHT